MKVLRKSSVLSSRLVVLILACFGCLIYPPRHVSGARMPAMRCAGIVQSIDPKSKTIILKPVPNGAPLKLGWLQDTAFFTDEKRVEADALKVGTTVDVRYHSPLFGRDYAISIAWHSAPKQSSRFILPEAARFAAR